MHDQRQESPPGEAALPDASPTLAALLLRGPLPPREAAELVEKLARAVESSEWDGEAPGRLRPENVRLGTDGVPQVLKIAHSGGDASAAPYQAPEVDRPEKVLGPEADVFTLGVILYQTITGSSPFCGADDLAIREQVRRHAPVAPRRLQPKLPRALETICLKCLRKSPQRRYINPRALSDDLRRYLEGRRILARREPFWERLVAFVRYNPMGAVIVMALAAAVLAGVATLEISRRELAVRLQTRNARMQEAWNEAARVSEPLLEGTLRMAENDPQQAKRMLAAAGDLYEGLLPEHAPPQSLAGHARLLNDLAEAYVEINELGPAEQAVNQALAIHEQLVARLPRLLTNHVGLGRSRRIRGDVLRARGATVDALAAYSKAEETVRRLIDLRPSDRALKYELSQVLTGEGSVHVQQDALDQASKAYEEAFTLAAQSGGDPADPQEHRRQLAVVYQRRAELLQRYAGVAELEAALDQYRSAREIYQELCDRDPSNPRLKRDLDRVTAAIAELQDS